MITPLADTLALNSAVKPLILDVGTFTKNVSLAAKVPLMLPFLSVTIVPFGALLKLTV